MGPVTTPNEPVPAREQLRLTRAMLAELDLLDFELDLVAPDRESASAGDDAGDFLVTGGGLRIVLKIYWAPVPPDTAPAEDHGILTVGQALLKAAPDVDAIVVALPPAPYRSVVIDAFAVGAAVDVPSGIARELPRGELHPSLREALRQLVAPADVDWSGLPARPLVTFLKSLADREHVNAHAAVVLAELRAKGTRAHRGSAKRQTWPALSERDAAWAASRVHEAFSSTGTAGRLANDLDAFLDGVGP